MSRKELIKKGDKILEYAMRARKVGDHKFADLCVRVAERYYRKANVMW